MLCLYLYFSSFQISVIYHNSKKMILVVDRRHIKSMENEKKSMPFSDVYIGGAPTEILKSRLVYNHSKAFFHLRIDVRL